MRTGEGVVETKKMCSLVLIDALSNLRASVQGLEEHKK